MDQYLPALIAVLGVAITAYVNYRLGKLKSRDDSKDSVRDDILVLVDKYETREKRQTEMIDKLQNRLTELLDQLDICRTDNRTLRTEKQQLTDELNSIKRKVYYIPPAEDKKE